MASRFSLEKRGLWVDIIVTFPYQAGLTGKLRNDSRV